MAVIVRVPDTLPCENCNRKPLFGQPTKEDEEDGKEEVVVKEGGAGGK